LVRQRGEEVEEVRGVGMLEFGSEFAFEGVPGFRVVGG
jgi:hypothetical protein